MNEKIERIFHDNSIIALILRADYCREGIEFFTPESFSQQLAYMKRPSGYKIPLHRKVIYTQEVLFIRKGKVKVDFYDMKQNYLESRLVQAGDVILLASGGHGFEMLEESEMIEVKQGPFTGEKDKTRFEPRES